MFGLPRHPSARGHGAPMPMPCQTHSQGPGSSSYQLPHRLNPWALSVAQTSILVVQSIVPELEQLAHLSVVEDWSEALSQVFTQPILLPPSSIHHQTVTQTALWSLAVFHPSATLLSLMWPWQSYWGSYLPVQLSSITGGIFHNIFTRPFGYNATIPVKSLWSSDTLLKPLSSCRSLLDTCTDAPNVHPAIQTGKCIYALLWVV